MTQQQLCKVDIINDMNINDINLAFNDEMHFLPAAAPAREEFGFDNEPRRAALLHLPRPNCCHRCYESTAAAAAGRPPSVPTPA